MDKFVSKNVKNMKPSGIRKFFDLVLGAKDVVSLGVGEPDYSTPWKICNKAIESLEDGYTSYTSNKGLPELRKEISKFLKKQYGLSYNAEEEILITSGVGQGLDIAMRAIIDPGDKIVIINPSYVAYPAVVELAGGRVVNYDTNPDKGFKVDPQDLKKLLIKHKPKAVLFNYPCNPSGVTYTRSELIKIVRVIKEADVLLLSDEIYDLLSYDYKHTPIPVLKGAKERTLYFNGFSKGYAMTGWRIAYVCGPKDLIAQMTKIFGFVMLSAPITGQFAAIEALKSQKEVSEMIKEYKRRRNFIVKAMNDIGLETQTPEGAFYCFSSVKSTGMDALEFATDLFNKEKVAVVPGDAFGEKFGDYIRISYASPYEDLKEAAIRIKKYLKR